MEHLQLVASAPPQTAPTAPMMMPMLQPMQHFAGPPLEDGHTLGLALLLTGVGSALGVAYAGIFGGIAGGLAGGSVVNAVRAYRCMVKGTQDDDREAIISGTYSVIGAAAAGYLLYKGRSMAKPNGVAKENDDG